MIDSVLYTITTFFIIVLACFHIYKLWRWSYWRKRGLETYEPKFTDIGLQYYNSYFYFKKKGLKHGGTYLFFHPHYVAVDLDLIKKILISDFDHFVNRNLFEHKGEENYMHAHLFNLEDQLWKELRNKLTPTFTSGKIKMMFKTLIDTTYGLEEVFREHSELKTPLEMKDVMTRFTVDVISSVGLGIESNTLKNPQSDFIKFAKILMVNFDDKTAVSYLLSSLPQWLTTILQMLFKNLIKKYEFIQTPIEEFFKKVVTETVTYREKNNIIRQDFLHLLLLLKNNPEDLKDHQQPNGSLSKLYMNELIAQCFLFFTAGYDTTSTALTFACYELARNPEVQEKLRREIHTILAKNEGSLSYDIIAKMTYLERVVHETLRMYPAVKTLNRICKKDYHVDGTDVTIKKNDMVMIPIQAIHYDPDLYPEPQKFNPDRFSDEDKTNTSLTQYLPFGEGPRMCIGSRFALLQIKVGLVCIINKYRLSLNTKTELPPKIVQSFLTNGIQTGIWMNVEQI